MTIDEAKDLVLFAKQHGLQSISFDGLEAVMYPTAAPLGDLAMGPAEEPEDYETALLRSSE